MAKVDFDHWRRNYFFTVGGLNWWTPYSIWWKNCPALMESKFKLEAVVLWVQFIPRAGISPLYWVTSSSTRTHDDQQEDHCWQQQAQGGWHLAHTLALTWWCHSITTNCFQNVPIWDQLIARRGRRALPFAILCLIADNVMKTESRVMVPPYQGWATPAAPVLQGSWLGGLQKNGYEQ